VKRAAGLTVLLGALWAAPCGAAHAAARDLHTQLEGSTPAANDTVPRAPAELVLTFGGLVEESGMLLRLLGPAGRSWTLEGRRAPGSSRVLRSDLPALGPGGYRVEWRVVSGDGHPISGDFVFYVGDGATPLATAPPPLAPAPGDLDGEGGLGAAVPALLPSVRAVCDAVELLLAGLLLFGAFRGGRSTGRTHAVTNVLALVAPALVAAYAWIWAGSVVGLDAGGSERLDAFGALFSGRGVAAELVLLVLVPWAIFLARRRKLATVLAALAIFAGAFAGHAASHTASLSIPASAVHQLAVATWLGGLLFLITEARSEAWRASVERVSDAAIAAVVVVTLTGILQAWLLVDSLGQLTTTTYGLLLLAKGAGLLGLVAFGAYHRLRLVPAVSSEAGAARLRRSVGAELALTVAVVVIAAVMSHIPPNP